MVGSQLSRRRSNPSSWDIRFSSIRQSLIQSELSVADLVAEVCRDERVARIADDDEAAVVRAAAGRY